MSWVLYCLGLTWTNHLGLKGKKLYSKKEEGLIRALSKLRAPRAAAYCQRGGPKKLRNYAAPVRGWNWRMNEPTAQQGREALPLT